ncbi:hypothetical protein [Sphingomonas alpina]|uniref:Uncharacterized protein n=1 Tax=Sphingomonas alpina TaxID=653931 RepID=A0A7H0LFA4_9SPHN|nr:hypothetical protein [Sphingomonas alpina]QNQ08357.1 hypothetical protein H3Z74_16595 [Sphingomonas alpina]
MRITSEQSLSDAPIGTVLSEGIAAQDIATPVVGSDEIVAPAGSQNTALSAATWLTGAAQDIVSDTGAALRRMKMRLYSRMMTDLSVLTQNERLPTDAEIHEALHRAARAQGLSLRPTGQRSPVQDGRRRSAARR